MRTLPYFKLKILQEERLAKNIAQQRYCIGQDNKLQVLKFARAASKIKRTIAYELVCAVVAIDVVCCVRIELFKRKCVQRIGIYYAF